MEISDGIDKCSWIDKKVDLNSFSVDEMLQTK